MAPELPHEVILFNILTRLPPKSAFRFRCVAKRWHSFLTTQTFSNMHLPNIAKDHQENPNKLLMLSTTTPYMFRTIDCEAPEDGLTARRSLPFEANYVWIKTSFHGLVCVRIKKSITNSSDIDYYDLILWNPLTGEYKILSNANAHMDCYNNNDRAFGLYYNSFEDDYKLICVTYDYGIYIYSLKSDSWRKVDSSIDFDIPIPVCWGSSTWLGEQLYFLGENMTHQYYSVIRFDTKTEKLTKIVTPLFGNKMIVCLSLNVLKGCLHFCVLYDDLNVNLMDCCLKIELWRLDEDGKWENVETYTRTLCSPWFLWPLHMMKNGKWLINSKDKDCMYKVDMEKNIGDISCWYSGVRICPTAKYVETFVSPNRYMK